MNNLDILTVYDTRYGTKTKKTKTENKKHTKQNKMSNTNPTKNRGERRYSQR